MIHDLRQQRTWLIEQARAEAAAREDDFAGTLFKGLDPKNFSQADGDSCCLYLFGDTHPEFDAETGARLKD